VASNYSNLEIFRHRTPARIPKGFPTTILQSDYTHAEIKALCSFYSLKVAFESSVIVDYKKKRQSLAQYLNCKESTLRTRLKFLFNLGLITKDVQNKNGKQIPYLYLKRYIEAKEILKDYIPGYVNPKNKRQNTINYPIINNPNLYETLQTLAINENFQRQKFKVVEYILNKEVKRIGIDQLEKHIIPTNGHKKVRKQLRTRINNHFGYYCYKYMRDKYNFLNPNLETQNTDISLSCKGISNLLNKKSNQSGHTIINKLQKQNLIQIEKRNILLDKFKNYSFKQFQLLKESLHPNTQHRLIFKHGNTYLKLTNKITLNINNIFETKNFNCIPNDIFNKVDKCVFSQIDNKAIKTTLNPIQNHPHFNNSLFITTL
jgi:hypothetical protein